MWKVLELANVTLINLTKGTKKLTKLGLILNKYVSVAEFVKLKVSDPSRDNERD